ncbi:hypothetical protein BYT27DRAFT_7173847 [Phlegmacium glaucopus]|nr:hypothetical protein BYT27DRAFT_7173847 [Phlegmacium glaucopus]
MLLEFWYNGIRFSRTAAYYYGRVVQCALICLVSNLPAARKTSGFASIHHTQMCAMCHCTQRPEDPLNDSFATLGKQRTNEDIRNSAQVYLNAENEKDRSEAVHNTGIRWSELFRLPYFDTSCFVVVDAMHNLFLGLVQEHFDILGIRLNNTNSKTTPSIVVDIPEGSINRLNIHECKSVTRLINILEAPIKKELKSGAGYDVYFKRLFPLHRAALELVCTSVGAPLKRNSEHIKKSKLNKPEFIHSILAWRLTQTETPQNFTSGAILTAQEMAEIRSDIENMITPSWLTSVPTNLGEPSHGKLKADQWRTLGTTYLPISLIRLWDQLEDSSDKHSQQCKKLLEVTLSLISAVVIASSRTTSKEKADLYLHYMQNYLQGLHELFPQYRFLPNQHMALHLAEYLRFYGPVHSWWTFPFERLIGMLQRIPNNFQNGKLEETISTSFAKSANLRAFMLKDGCPPAIKNCSGHFSKLIDPQVRNTLRTDIARFLSLEDEADAPADITGRMTVIAEGPYKALQTYFNSTKGTPREAKILNSYTLNGLTFSTFTRHRGNSFILVRRPSLPSLPARIESILQVPTGETYFVVRFYLKTMSEDPFEKYPLLQSSLWSQDLGQLVIVKPQDVESHFAGLSFVWLGAECLAVVSLSREY